MSGGFNPLPFAASGHYTPAISISGGAAISSIVATYARVGKVVTVHGLFTTDFWDQGESILIALPIPSGGGTKLGGIAQSAAYDVAPNITFAVAVLEYNGGGAGGQCTLGTATAPAGADTRIAFSFQYEIV